VVFKNLEAAVAEKGESVNQDRGFLAPPEALDALTTCGFNLLALANNQAACERDLRAPGTQPVALFAKAWAPSRHWAGDRGL
jgi:hypothetical protein